MEVGSLILHMWTPINSVTLYPIVMAYVVCQILLKNLYLVLQIDLHILYASKSLLVIKKKILKNHQTHNSNPK